MGISGLIAVEKFDSSVAKQIIDTNVIGMINCIEALLPDFIKSRNGMIVGVSSLADGRGFPKSGVYCASKAAASIFLESMRAELKSYNVKVLTVKPGFVRTPMTAKNNFAMPFLIKCRQGGLSNFIRDKERKKDNSISLTNSHKC